MKSALEKMPGDDDGKFANLRLLLGYLYALAGKKHVFMGTEFGQRSEWDHDGSLDWHLRDDPRHEGILRWQRELNQRYRDLPALHRGDCRPEGFVWIEPDDAKNRVLCFLRSTPDRSDLVLFACNFSQRERPDYRVGAPETGDWGLVLDSDAETYGGHGTGAFPILTTEPIGAHDHPQSLAITLPPLSIVAYRGPRP